MALLDVFKKDKKKSKSLKKKTEKARVKVEKSKEAKKETKKGHKANVNSRAYKILIRPTISEKATDLNIDNKYVFQVVKKAEKKDIINAINAVYGIKPIKVNIISLKGKARRYGKSTGRTSDKKKAIVTLPKGQTIQIYEGV